MDGEVTIAVPIEGPNNFKIEVECLGLSWRPPYSQFAEESN